MKKTIKTIINLSLLPLLLVSCDGNKDDSKKEKGFVTAEAMYLIPKYQNMDFVVSKDATFKYGYYQEQEQIIYMTLDVALSYLYKDNNVTRDIKNKVATYTIDNGMSFIVDSNNDTILAKKYSLINLFSMKYDTSLGIIDEESTTKYVKDAGSVYTEEEDVLFNLKSYNLDIVYEKDDVYIPFTIVNYITFNAALYSSVCFNGSNFYLLNMLNGAMDLYYSGTSFADSFYHKSVWSGKKKEAYNAEHIYQSFMFSLDHFYGFNDERFAPFSSYLQKNEPQLVLDLKSTDESVYNKAVEKLIAEVIGDGHTNAGNATGLFGGGQYKMEYYTSQREQELYMHQYEVSSLRRQAGVKVNQLRFSGKTAILSFDGFNHSSTEFNQGNIEAYAENNKDTFALFYKSFKELEAKTGIENVIFDITCNGGGDTNALVPMAGFLTDVVRCNMYNPLNKQNGALAYKVDTNLDGKYDENDNYAGKYNFYILTSHFSFSCANLFPHMLKENGVAKIIGEQSGGGACVVYYTATPDGRCYRISGNMRNGYDDNHAAHDDFGVEVDYELSKSHFYSDSYLNNFVNNLPN